MQGRAQSDSVYLKYAFGHPWQLALLGVGAIVGAASFSFAFPLLLVLAVELVTFLMCFRSRNFRRYVDGQCEKLARARAAELRAALLAQMRKSHRDELASLEAVIDRSRDASKPYGLAGQSVVDECSALLSTFVQLAIAYNASRECLDSVDWDKVEGEGRALEAMVCSPSPDVRDIVRRRLRVVRDRIERRERSSEGLEILAQQLSMIADVVRLTHEELAAPPDPRSHTDEIAGISRVLIGGHAPTRELSALLRVDRVVDHEVLVLGRGHPDAPAQESPATSAASAGSARGAVGIAPSGL